MATTIHNIALELSRNELLVQAKLKFYNELGVQVTDIRQSSDHYETILSALSILESRGEDVRDKVIQALTTMELNKLKNDIFSLRPRNSLQRTSSIEELDHRVNEALLSLRKEFETLRHDMEKIQKEYNETMRTIKQEGSEGYFNEFASIKDPNMQARILELKYIKFSNTKILNESLFKLTNLEKIELRKIRMQHIEHNPVALTYLKYYTWDELSSNEDLKDFYDSYQENEIIKRLMWVPKSETFKSFSTNTIKNKEEKKKPELQLIDVIVDGIQLYKMNKDNNELIITFKFDDALSFDFEIKKLALSRCSIPSSFRTNLTTLTHLNLYKIDGTDATVIDKILAKNRDLEEVVITLKGETDVEPKIIIPALPNLTKLCITLAHIKKIEQNQTLQTLSLVDCRFSAKFLETSFTEKFRKLKKFGLNNVKNHNQILNSIILNPKNLDEVFVSNYEWRRDPVPNSVHYNVHSFLNKHQVPDKCIHFTMKKQGEDDWVVKECNFDDNFQLSYFKEFSRNDFFTYEAYKKIKSKK